MKRRMLFVALLALTATLKPVQAYSGSGSGTIFFEVGESFANMNKYTKDPAEGSPSLLGTLQPIFSLGADLGSFRPEFGYTIIARKPSDSSYSSTLMIIQLPYILEDTGIKVGPTYWIQKISGKGGDVTMPNGNSTATFSLPGRSSSAKTLGLLVGYTLPIMDTISLDTDLTVLAPLSKRRSFNFIAQLSWSFYDL